MVDWAGGILAVGRAGHDIVGNLGVTVGVLGVTLGGKLGWWYLGGRLGLR